MTLPKRKPRGWHPQNALIPAFVRNVSEAAYRRTDLFKRRRRMDAWMAYVVLQDDENPSLDRYGTAIGRQS